MRHPAPQSPADGQPGALLRVDRLSIDFPGPEGSLPVVEDVSFSVGRGEVVAIVGQSGSGKSLTAAALLGLLPHGARVRSGSLAFAGRALDLSDTAGLQPLRGVEIGMVFQEPMTALNPVLPIGEQIAEGLVRHKGLTWRQASAAAVGLLDRVGIADPARRATQYLHQLSGGMRQRVMIATAIACGPKLLVADEATTALDVTIQAQILRLIAELQADTGMGVLFITHDLAVVAQIADRVAVMHRGRIVETGTTRQVLGSPGSETTRALLAALPGAGTGGTLRLPANPRAARTPLVEVRGLSKRYPASTGLFEWRKREVVAISDVAFDVGRGEVVALVGESSSGKTTIGRCILDLVPPGGGSIRFDGRDTASLRGAERRALRRRMQIVFQDPYASLNPKLDVRTILGEAIRFHGLAHGAAVDERVGQLLELVGLEPSHARRKPHAFSGGQRQRIAIARALAVEPELLVADEAVSALDVSVRAQILRLFAELRDRLDLTILFITHDLGLVRHFADRVVVLYLGEVVEEGPVGAVFASPRHPYTAALLASDPHISDAQLERPRARPAAALAGDVPSPIRRPGGCVFHTRCPNTQPLCTQMHPIPTTDPSGVRVACHFPLGRNAQIHPNALCA